MNKSNEISSTKQLYKIQGYLECLEYLYLLKGDAGLHIFFNHQTVVLKTEFEDFFEDKEWGLPIFQLVNTIFKHYKVDKESSTHDFEKEGDIDIICSSIGDNLIEMIYNFTTLKGKGWKTYRSEKHSKIYFRQLESEQFYSFYYYVSD